MSEKKHLKIVYRNPDSTKVSAETSSDGVAFEFDLSSKKIVSDGELLGETIPLLNVEDVAAKMDLHPMAIPTHMAANSLPLYSIGEEVYVDLLDLKHLIEDIGVVF